MNSKQDEILTILAEECAEVIVAVSKVRRFGLEQNVQALKQELADVRCMLDLVESFNVASYQPQELASMVLAKQKKLERYSGIFT